MLDALQHDLPIQAVQPDLPEPEAYLPWLQEMHRNGFYSNFGPLCRDFADRMLAEFGGEGEACVPCANATAGLSAALIASDATGPVLIPGFTFPATLGAVRAAGLEAVVMDVDADLWFPRPDQLDEALAGTGAGAAILVAPFGIVIDFAAHLETCRRHGAILILDCAAGLGVPRVNFCRSPDLFEVFSMHATKPFGVGEGGVIFCHASREAAVKSALNFALPTYATAEGPHNGFNGKLSELHAAVGLAQLGRYRDFVAGRQRFARRYYGMLAEFPDVFALPATTLSPWQIFPVALPDERAVALFVETAAADRIEIRRYYRPSLSTWPGVRIWNACPVSEALASRMAALPVRAIAGDGDAAPIIDRIARALRAAGAAQ